MLKKACVILLALSGCAFANNSENSTAYNEAKYKISDMDMLILIRQMNNIEQCIYPDLAKPNSEKVYERWDDADHLAMNYFENQILQELVGEQNFKQIQTDKLSMHYFNLQHRKLNHQKGNVSLERCEEFKPMYQKVYQGFKSLSPFSQK